MNTLTKTNIFGRPRLLNWVTTGLLTGWVLVVAVVVEVNGVVQETNMERNINSIESGMQEADEQLCSVYSIVLKHG